MMSTSEIRAPHAPRTWSLRNGFARLASVVLMAIDVFTEAQRQAQEAQRRYPFIES
jgi:hypothetical protein